MVKPERAFQGSNIKATWCPFGHGFGSHVGRNFVLFLNPPILHINLWPPGGLAETGLAPARPSRKTLPSGCLCAGACRCYFPPVAKATLRVHGAWSLHSGRLGRGSFSSWASPDVWALGKETLPALGLLHLTPLSPQVTRSPFNTDFPTFRLALEEQSGIENSYLE